jgi:hypothetical protein
MLPPGHQFDWHPGGSVRPDQFYNNFLQGGVNGINNNFGELLLAGS